MSNGHLHMYHAEQLRQPLHELCTNFLKGPVVGIIILCHLQLMTAAGVCCNSGTCLPVGSQHVTHINLLSQKLKPLTTFKTKKKSGTGVAFGNYLSAASCIVPMDLKPRCHRKLI